MELEAVSLLPPETPATTFATIVAEGKATPAGTPPPKEKEAEVTPTPVATELPVTASVAMDTGEMVAGVTAKDFHTQMMLRKRTRKEGRTRTHSNHHQKIKRRRD